MIEAESSGTSSWKTKETYMPDDGDSGFAPPSNELSAGTPPSAIHLKHSLFSDLTEKHVEAKLNVLRESS